MHHLAIVILVLLLYRTYCSVLVALPASSAASLQNLLHDLNNGSYFPLSISTVSCNEDYDDVLLSDNLFISHKYLSHLFCRNDINDLLYYYNSTTISDSFRFELLRPSFLMTIDIDVMLSAIMQSTTIVFDSSHLNDAFMQIVKTLLAARMEMTDITHNYPIYDSLRVWKLTKKPKYLSYEIPESKLTLDDNSIRTMNWIATNASDFWLAGQFPDRDCNCGKMKIPDKPTCVDLDEDTLINIERFKVHPPVPDSVQSGVTPLKKKLLLCMVYTITPRHHNLRAIVETWGKRCDGFIAWSNETDTSISAVHIYNPRLNGVESYDVMWYKVISIWDMMIQIRLVDQYEYFYLCGDDVYVIVNNLRQYLTSDFLVRRSQGGRLPVYLGRRTPHNHYLDYATGESGYVLNAQAVRLLVDGLERGDCLEDVRVSMEDVMVANCLLNQGLEVLDTRDNKGNERFITWKIGDLFHQSWRVNRYEGHQRNMKSGLEGFSEYSVSFHWMTPNEYMYCVDGYFQSITPESVNVIVN